MPIANEANSGGRHPAVLTSDVPDQEKRRVASDGHSYTFQQFLDYYGEEWGNSKWSAAQDTPPPPPAPPVQTAAVNTLLTPRTAEEIRTSTRIAGTCKKEMRAFLDETSNSQPRDPDVLAFDIPADVSWKHYIARHQDSKRIIRSGITKAQVRFFPKSRIQTAVGNCAWITSLKTWTVFAASCTLETRARMPNPFSSRCNDGDEQTATITSCCKFKMQ